MEQKYLILSDIHGNISAFDSVLSDCKEEDFTGVILLGDCIDYGMRSNETISMLQELISGKWKDKVLVNIWGNHEQLLTEKNLERLSSDRGRMIANYTAEHISGNSMAYILTAMNRKGQECFKIHDLKCLAVHGSLEDYYWKAVSPDNARGDYSDFDIVFSGHSHYSHCFTKFYSTDNEELRNKKAVIFINPGSVGQPRNQNPCAQYAVLSLPSKRVELRCVPYDVEFEQSLFPDVLDAFYKTRLTKGI
ncbi:MAG: metallophosphoesterase family protein [Acidaminococcaceae bacterium]|nr:metallophosphoesterase family protein [Acidaminococcaceae bacterium]